MLYKNLNKKIIHKNINKLRSLNYNAYRWWRQYDSPNKPLDKKSPLWDKILNGDFEFSHFYWQAKFNEIEINKIYSQCNPDLSLFNERASLQRARRKRLWIDFEKDEKNRLEQLQKEFIANFFISKKEYEEELIEFGSSIKNFYIYCENKFGKRIKKLSKRGRPKKLMNESIT